jgi:integrase
MIEPAVEARTEAEVPTFAQFQVRAVAACTPYQRRKYVPVWRRACETIGHLQLDCISVLELRIVKQQSIERSARGNYRRSGRYTGESVVRALRCLFVMAEQDQWIEHRDNPAAQLDLPRRLPSTRRALTSREVAEINQVVPVGSRDAALDCLIIRLHLETACRRAGALGLRLADLDTRWCLVCLREKGSTVRWQPISPTLAAALNAHARERGAKLGQDALLRQSNHRPLHTSHYDALWKRIHRRLPWAAAHGISIHWLRHTTITWVERRFGYGVARAYAGHTDTASAPTATFIRSSLPEVAAALSALTGEPHPLTNADHPHGPDFPDPRRG